MIKVHCRTNLDLDPAEIWPTELPAVPRVGDLIQSATKWRNGFQLRLEVMSVTWKTGSEGCGWWPEVELHIRRSSNYTLTGFYEWYAPKVGCSVSAFI